MPMTEKTQTVRELEAGSAGELSLALAKGMWKLRIECEGNAQIEKLRVGNRYLLVSADPVSVQALHHYPMPVRLDDPARVIAVIRAVGTGPAKVTLIAEPIDVPVQKSVHEGPRKTFRLTRLTMQPHAGPLAPGETRAFLGWPQVPFRVTGFGMGPRGASLKAIALGSPLVTIEDDPEATFTPERQPLTLTIGVPSMLVVKNAGEQPIERPVAWLRGIAMDYDDLHDAYAIPGPLGLSAHLVERQFVVPAGEHINLEGVMPYTGKAKVKVETSAGAATRLRVTTAVSGSECCLLSTDAVPIDALEDVVATVREGVCFKLGLQNEGTEDERVQVLFDVATRLPPAE